MHQPASRKASRSPDSEVPRAGVIGAMERTKEIAVALNQSLQEVAELVAEWAQQLARFNSYLR